MKMSLWPSALAAFLGVAWSVPAHAQAQEDTVALYTMGPGDDVFSRYGHAALCVHDAETPAGRCYNYGTTDFSTPIPLTWDVLRGRARFWVSSTSLDAMLAWYGPAGQDRTLWRQVIPLAPEAFAALRQRLHNDMQPGQREYTYHHFRDNCTTRLRDHLDAISNGALRTGSQQPYTDTWRTLVLQGLSTSPALLVSAELLLGRPLASHPSRWEAMFLPAVMRREVSRAFGVEAEIVHERSRPVPMGNPAAGRSALLVIAAALGAISMAAARLQTTFAARALRVLVGATLGITGAIVWTLSLVTTLPELARNDLRFVFVPSDLVLGVLMGRRLYRYALLRTLMALTAFVVDVAGGSLQPLAVPAVVVACAMLPWTLMREVS